MNPADKTRPPAADLERIGPSDPLALTVPPELVELIAVRVADLVTERLQPPEAEPYLNAEAAAEYLAAPKTRIYDLTGQGQLRYYRDGRRLLFRRADLDAVLDVVEIEAE